MDNHGRCGIFEFLYGTKLKKCNFNSINVWGIWNNNVGAKWINEKEDLKHFV